MADVILHNLMKVYPGGVVAVNDANLHIRDGQFVVLVGPSGCGKSTTLRMVAGLEEITGGTISIGGNVVNEVQPKDRDIAMVFQDYALYPHMDVYRNMAFGLKLRKYSRTEIEQRVSNAAKVLGLENLLLRKPKELSGGQRQRVALGRAIVRQPKVFLFDEPLSNLDAKLRVEMRAELKRLHRQLSTTTIYVTHDQEEAMTLGDVVVVMKDGLIQQIGSPLDVYWTPVNRFVAGFVGMPPMNFLNGKLSFQGSNVVFEDGSATITLSDRQADAVKNWVGKEVVFGVRPEAISLVSERRFMGTGNEMSVTINVIEPLGEKMDMYLSTKEHPHMIARVDAQRDIKDGQTATVYLDVDRCHIFEPGDLGANLLVQKDAAGAAVVKA